jgi:hypothetical protein
MATLQSHNYTTMYEFIAIAQEILAEECDEGLTRQSTIVDESKRTHYVYYSQPQTILLN